MTAELMAVYLVVHLAEWMVVTTAVLLVVGKVAHSAVEMVATMVD